LYPGSKDKGGELNWISRRPDRSRNYEKTAFSQSKGQISDPVQTTFGFHIIQTEDKEDAHMKPLAEVSGDMLKKAIKQEKSKGRWTQARQIAESIAQKSKRLEEGASQDYGAQVSKAI